MNEAQLLLISSRDCEELTMQTNTPSAVLTDRTVDADLETRIRAEFAEMPGLKLTLPQASRLFNVESVRCERILIGLVTDGELWNSGESFLRAGARRASW